MAEALRCYNANAYRGVVVMCRRALQETAVDQGIEAPELKDQIREMKDKRRPLRCLVLFMLVLASPPSHTAGQR